MTPGGSRAARLFAAALLFRLLVAVAARSIASESPGGPFNYTDPISYRRTAHAIAETGTFAEGPLRANRPPLYPFFLSLVFRAAGDTPWAWTVPQAALGAATCLWLVPIGRALATERAGWIAAWILAFWPHHAAYTPLALTETLFMFLFLGHAAFSLRLDRTGRAVVAGALGGLAVLTRPVTLHFTPLALLLTAAAGRGDLRRNAFLALLLFLATLAPWTVRNRFVLGDWVPVATRLGHDLYEGNCPQATGGPIPDKSYFPEDLAGLAETERDRTLARRALAYMRDHPARTAYLSARKVLRTWNPFPNDPRHRTALVAGALGLGFGALLVLAALGARHIAWAPAAIVWLAILPCSVTALHALLLGSVRFRLTWEPFLAVMAAAFLASRSRRMPPAGPS